MRCFVHLNFVQEVEYEILLEGRHRFRALSDLEKVIDVALDYASLLVYCSTTKEGLLIANTKAAPLNNLFGKVTVTGQRNFSLVAIVKSVMNFGIAFQREQSVSFFHMQMVYDVDDKLMYDFLTSSIRQTYYFYIWLQKILQQLPIVSNMTMKAHQRIQELGRWASSTSKKRLCSHQMQKRLRFRFVPKTITFINQ